MSINKSIIWSNKSQNRYWQHLFICERSVCSKISIFKLINEKGICVKHFNDPKIFIEYLNDIDNIYKNTEEYNLNEKRQIMIVFDDIIAVILSNKET